MLVLTLNNESDDGRDRHHVDNANLKMKIGD